MSGQGQSLLLAIDTCGAVGSVALGRVPPGATSAVLPTPTALLISEAELPGKTYSALLVLRIGELLRAAGLSLADLAALVVVNGPGSFTGVRVGVSVAKGLAEGAELPAIAVSRLEVLAAKARAGQVATAKANCAALDAGRGEFYFGQYREGLPAEEALCSAEEVLAHVRELQARELQIGEAQNWESSLRLAVCEPGVAERLAAASPLLVAAPSAADALTFAAERFLAAHFVDPALLDGNYIRRPYAEGIVEDTTSQATTVQAKTSPPATNAAPPPALSIRPMTIADIEAVLALERAVPEAPHWSPTEYHAYLRASKTPPEDSGPHHNPEHFGIVAESAPGVLIGFAVARLLHLPPGGGGDNLTYEATGELESIVIAANARSQGTGTALLRAVVDLARAKGARRLELEVRASNHAALRLYVAAGLREEGRRLRYYSQPAEDAILMGVALT